MDDRKHVFQITGIKNPQIKGKLLRGIHKLGASYVGGSMYTEQTTHMIVSNTLASEKFLCACAAGKWIVTPQYVTDSVEHGEWLPEEIYEVDFISSSLGDDNPIRMWRTRVASGSLSGAFQDWRVVLLIEDPNRSSIFKRILLAGKARVQVSPSDCSVTHVFASHVTEDTRFNAPCHTVDYIGQHLFGIPWSKMVEEPTRLLGSSYPYRSRMDTSRQCDDDTLLFSELELQLKDHISKPMALKRNLIHGTTAHLLQSSVLDFVNVQSLIDSGLLTVALQEMQHTLQPGVLPSTHYLCSLLHHALHAEAKPYFYSTLIEVLYTILRNNPTWGSPTAVKYFLNILQCPQCKGGTWALLETSVRWCMSSGTCCHSLPAPPSPELICFHGNLQTFLLTLFQYELYASSSGQCGGPWSSVLMRSFWSIWEWSALCNRTVRHLAELLVQATAWALPSSEDWKQKLVCTLHDILAVVVDYWCQEHSKLNVSLAEQAMEDLAEHISALCQDQPPEFLLEFIPSMPSLRLRMVTADSIYRNICCRRGLSLGKEPLTLQKILSCYLPALGTLCDGRATGAQGQRAASAPASLAVASCASPGLTAPAWGSGEFKDPANPGLCQKTVPKGLYRVNAAGESLIHRACRRNQVETLLHVLSLPGTDVNVTDHAGWTPLHEACNHGSTECVQALLQHCPTLNLDVQVGGVTPLQDALLNGHVDIAKTLLQYAGSHLLEQRDTDGRSPLDIVSSPDLQEQLRSWARDGDRDSAGDTCDEEATDSALLEACSCLLRCLLLSYTLVRDVPCYEALADSGDAVPRLAQALATHPAHRVTATWGSPPLVRLAGDLETVLGLGWHLCSVPVSVRRCQGPHTSLLLLQLEDLQADGAALLGNSASLLGLPTARPALGARCLGP